MDLYLRIERAGVSVARIFEFLDVGKEQEEQTGQGLRLPELRGEIDFRGVSFVYDVNEPVLRR